MEFIQYVNILKRKIPKNKDKIIFICIGTKDILWDSLGPAVGTYLKKSDSKIKVLGDIDNNFYKKQQIIYNSYELKNKFVIAIDTAIVQNYLNKKIFITNSPIIMGDATRMQKGKIGDLAIKYAISEINNITKKEISRVAKFLASGICEALN